MDIIDEICDRNEFDGLNFSEEELASSPIRNYFRGKVVFLTGVTGFLGQLYLEKLLRCDVQRVYVLARAKRNQTAAERLRRTLAGVQFSKLRQHDPNFQRRITVVEGDLSQLGVGIQARDLQELRARVEIVVHAAADVRFNERLFDLVMTNLRGTREMLAMAESFAKLEVFAYVSTAYSHCPRDCRILEEFYEPPVDPDTIIAYAENCQSRPAELQAFEVLTERIIRPWPNTYSYSKSLSEELVRRWGRRFSCCVLRPSIVYSTYQEPLAGWSHNVFGINGFLAAIMSGLSRVVLRQRNTVVDVVCADFVINATLAAIWATHQDAMPRELPATPPIYCISSSVDSPLTIEQISPGLVELFEEEPTGSFVWVVCVNATSSLLLFRYLAFFFHFLPCALADCVARLAGSRRRLLPLMRRVQNFTLSLSYFMTHEWRLDNANMRAVMDRMAPIDRRLFMCDLREFNFSHWNFTYLRGIKVFLLNDSMEPVGGARLKYRVMKRLHLLVRLAFYAIQLGLIYVLAKVVGIM